MEEKAKELWVIIDTVCGGYHIYKDEKVIEKAKQAAGQVQEYCEVFLQGNDFGFLQGNIFGMEEEEYQELYGYVVQVLKDFVEALEQGDTIWMLDTLDYGLRELVDLYREKNEAMA